MKFDKKKVNRLIIRVLMVLGFGGAVGLLGSCSASRASRSRNVDSTPVADSVVVRDGDAPVQVMYGVPPARFDPDRRPIREAERE